MPYIPWEEGPAKGLIAVRHTIEGSTPSRYPDVKPELPARSRGVIALVEENCTSCMLCARECPDWCIYIDSHKETIPAPEGGRPRVRNVLDRFAIDFSLCMYCGICVEVCPFDALYWSPEFEYAEYDIRDLLHEKDRLGTWMKTVPSPPALEPDTAAAADPAPPTHPEVRPAARTTTPTEPARRPAPDRAPEPAAAPRGPRERLANARSIRPPGSLPARPGTPSAPGGADSTGSASPAAQPGETAPAASAERDRTGDRPGRGSARDLLTNVRSIRPPGALPARPGTPSAPGGADSTAAASPAAQPEEPSPAASAERDRTGDRTGRRSARELLANVRSIRPPGALPGKRNEADAPPPDASSPSAAAGTPADPAAEPVGSPAEGEPGRPGGRPARRSARDLLANVRSIRPPGAAPKHPNDS